MIATTIVVGVVAVTTAAARLRPPHGHGHEGLQRREQRVRAALGGLHICSRQKRAVKGLRRGLEITRGWAGSKRQCKLLYEV